MLNTATKTETLTADTVIKDSQQPEYYARLGFSIEEGVKLSSDEIRAAYRVRVKFLHPDKIPQDSDNKIYLKAFRDVQEALEILNDNVKRQKYDSRLSQTADFTSFDISSGRAEKFSYIHRYFEIARDFSELKQMLASRFNYSHFPIPEEDRVLVSEAVNLMLERAEALKDKNQIPEHLQLLLDLGMTTTTASIDQSRLFKLVNAHLDAVDRVPLNHELSLHKFYKLHNISCLMAHPCFSANSQFREESKAAEKRIFEALSELVQFSMPHEKATIKKSGAEDHASVKSLSTLIKSFSGDFDFDKKKKFAGMLIEDVLSKITVSQAAFGSSLQVLYIAAILSNFYTRQDQVIMDLSMKVSGKPIVPGSEHTLKDQINDNMAKSSILNNIRTIKVQPAEYDPTTVVIAARERALRRRSDPRTPPENTSARQKSPAGGGFRELFRRINFFR